MRVWDPFVHCWDPVIRHHLLCFLTRINSKSGNSECCTRKYFPTQAFFPDFSWKVIFTPSLLATEQIQIFNLDNELLLSKSGPRQYTIRKDNKIHVHQCQVQIEIRCSPDHHLPLTLKKSYMVVVLVGQPITDPSSGSFFDLKFSKLVHLSFQVFGDPSSPSQYRYRQISKALQNSFRIANEVSTFLFI